MGNYQPLVTISATYGAGGSVIAPRLAEELGLPFVDRWISPQAAAEAVSRESLCEGEQTASTGSRILSYFARAASVGAMMAPDATVDGDEDLRLDLERDLAPLGRGRAAVLLGRAGAVVLAKRPRAFHVRLDGPVERRVVRAAEIESIDVRLAAKRLNETDKARTLFVRRLYRADASDPSWYHLVLDSTWCPFESTVELVAGAARQFFDSTATC